MLLTLILACTGGTVEAPAKAAPAGMVSAELLASTWQVRLAPDAARSAFEGRASWTAYFEGKRRDALTAMATESNPEGLARMHAEFAAMYQEAAVMAAQSIKQVYGVDSQPTDPLEVAYLLGEAGVILDDPALMARFGECGASKVPGLAARDAAWKAWVAAGGKPVKGSWPMGDIVRPGEVVLGEAPGLGAVPTYTFPERTPEALGVQAADLMSLWSLSLWHLSAAVKTGSDVPYGAFDLIQAHGAPAYRSMGWREWAGLPPAETTAETTPPPPTPSVSDAMLFLGPYTTAGDLALAAALRSPDQAASAVSAHVTDSPYAVVLQGCSESGKISVDCLIDQSAALGTAIEDGMAQAAGGAQDFHRFFAAHARAGLLRVAADAAFAAGDSDAGGKLRLNALDKAVGKAYDPLFVLSVAAWDAGNRNSVRATELVHPLVGEIPGLDVARISLDALHVRLSRSAAPGVPMH